MPSFSDSIFLFVLALLLFGPKKLPVLARELGKWVGEFRRASNEFKMQMEEELRQVEQADRQKQIAAMEAAAPVSPAIAEPEHPHLPAVSYDTVEETPAADVEPSGEPAADVEPAPARETLPIASAGELKMMPPATGLPTARGGADPLGGGLLESIPQTAEPMQEEEQRAVALSGAEADSHGR